MISAGPIGEPTGPSLDRQRRGYGVTELIEMFVHDGLAGSESPGFAFGKAFTPILIFWQIAPAGSFGNGPSV